MISTGRRLGLDPALAPRDRRPAPSCTRVLSSLQLRSGVPRRSSLAECASRQLPSRHKAGFQRAGHRRTQSLCGGALGIALPYRRFQFVGVVFGGRGSGAALQAGRAESRCGLGTRSNVCEPKLSELDDRGDSHDSYWSRCGQQRQCDFEPRPPLTGCLIPRYSTAWVHRSHTSRA